MRMRLYSAIIVGLMLRFMAYSTTTLSASGQRIIPMQQVRLECGRPDLETIFLIHEYEIFAQFKDKLFHMLQQSVS